MKVLGFRIRNFRSIIDSGWCDLSGDGVTAFVGQNESGKSSILEALRAFETGEIEEDDLRSDKSFPEICVSYAVDKKVKTAVPVAPVALFSGKLNPHNRLNLVKTWERDSSAELTEVVDFEEEWARNLFPLEYVNSDGEGELLTSSECAEEVWACGASIRLFKDDESLLPASIDLAELEKKGPERGGRAAALNFVQIAGVSLETLRGGSARTVKKHLEDASKAISADFASFWSQTFEKDKPIGFECTLDHHNAASGGTLGEPYLTFWVRDESETLYPRQRSKGVTWFLSFYLQLRARAKTGAQTDVLFLVDEPGASLHAKAQQNVLEMFEDLKTRMQIAYATHSPYLVDASKLYRVIAVQRGTRSQKYATKLIPAHELGSANTDTLFPIYTAMGLDLCHCPAIAARHNVLLEEISAYYYVSAFRKMLARADELHVIPCQGASNVVTVANLMLGWGLEFGVAVDDDSPGRTTFNRLKADLYGDDDDKARERLLKLATGDGIENVFSDADFERWVLEKSKPSNKTNAGAVHGGSKGVIAGRFFQKVEAGEIGLADLDQETRANGVVLVDEIARIAK